MTIAIPHIILHIFLSLVVVTAGFYLLLQLLIFVLCMNIGRILTITDRSAYDYLQNSSFWKNKHNNGKRLLLIGPATTKMRRVLLKMAKAETKELLFKSNTVLNIQCANCIFNYNCDQKYIISCTECTYWKKCPLLQNKNNHVICSNFKCARWIEKD